MSFLNPTIVSSSSDAQRKREASRSMGQVGDWARHTSKSGQEYYFNVQTRIPQWEKPDYEKQYGPVPSLPTTIRTTASSTSDQQRPQQQQSHSQQKLHSSHNHNEIEKEQQQQHQREKDRQNLHHKQQKQQQSDLHSQKQLKLTQNEREKEQIHRRDTDKERQNLHHQKQQQSDFQQKHPLSHNEREKVQQKQKEKERQNLHQNQQKSDYHSQQQLNSSQNESKKEQQHQQKDKERQNLHQKQQQKQQKDTDKEKQNLHQNQHNSNLSNSITSASPSPSTSSSTASTSSYPGDGQIQTFSRTFNVTSIVPDFRGQTLWVNNSILSQDKIQMINELESSSSTRAEKAEFFGRWCDIMDDDQLRRIRTSHFHALERRKRMKAGLEKAQIKAEDEADPGGAEERALARAKIAQDRAENKALAEALERSKVENKKAKKEAGKLQNETENLQKEMKVENEKGSGFLGQLSNLPKPKVEISKGLQPDQIPWFAKYCLDKIFALYIEMVMVPTGQKRRGRKLPGELASTPRYKQVVGGIVIVDGNLNTVLNIKIKHENKSSKDTSGFKKDSTKMFELEEAKNIVHKIINSNSSSENDPRLVIICGNKWDFTSLGLLDCLYNIFDLQNHYRGHMGRGIDLRDLVYYYFGVEIPMKSPEIDATYMMRIFQQYCLRMLNLNSNGKLDKSLMEHSDFEEDYEDLRHIVYNPFKPKMALRPLERTPPVYSTNFVDEMKKEHSKWKIVAGRKRSSQVQEESKSDSPRKIPRMEIPLECKF